MSSNVKAAHSRGQNISTTLSINVLNKMGFRLSPCLMPERVVCKSVKPPGSLTHD